MTLDAVRARRQMLALQRISDERIRRNARSNVRRVVSTVGSVTRESDDDAQGGPAVIVRMRAFIYPGNRYDAPTNLTGTILDKVIHKSGPVIVSESFGPDDIDPNGDIVIMKVAEQEQA